MAVRLSSLPQSPYSMTEPTMHYCGHTLERRVMNHDAVSRCCVEVVDIRPIMRGRMVKSVVEAIEMAALRHHLYWVDHECPNCYRKRTGLHLETTENDACLSL